MGDTVDYSWIDVRWPEWARKTLLVQLVGVGIVQFLVACNDIYHYAIDIAGAFTVIYWFAGAVCSAIAVASLSPVRAWFAPAVLVAEVLALLTAAFVLWADFTSPYLDWPVIIPASAALLVAIIAVPPLVVLVPQLPGRAWAGSLAIIAGLGLTQFVVENQIIPNRSVPNVAMTTSLAEIGRTGGVSHVKLIVTWKNEGKAIASVPGAFATLEAVSRAGAGTSALDGSSVSKTVNPLASDSTPFSRPLPQGFGRGIIWFEDLTPVASFIGPGMKDRIEYLVDVSVASVDSLHLHVYMAFLTNARIDEYATCDRSVSIADGNAPFLTAIRKPVTEGRKSYFCLRVPLRARNTVRKVTGDSPNLLAGYVFKAEDPDELGAFVEWDSTENFNATYTDLFRATERFNRRTPSLVRTDDAWLPLQRKLGVAKSTSRSDP